jgi:hypothetical protein
VGFDGDDVPIVLPDVFEQAGDVAATDLRRSAEAVERLARLGRAAIKELSDQLVLAIDETVAGPDTRGQPGAHRVAELRTLAA